LIERIYYTYVSIVEFIKDYLKQEISGIHITRGESYNQGKYLSGIPDYFPDGYSSGTLN
jgi:hypothetical protein